MLENTVTVRGDNVDDAIAKGLAQLGITRQEANIHVISEGKRGLFGFGKQDAIVEVARQTELSLSELTEQMTFTEATESNPDVEQTNQVETIDLSFEESSSIGPLEIEAETVIIDDDTVDEDSIDKEINQDDSVEVMDETEEDIAESIARAQVEHYIEEVLKVYGAEAQVTSYVKGNRVSFEIETDKTGLVIGRHGNIINSLQTLAQVMLHNLYRRRVNVVLNVGNYRKRRAKILKQMAERTADKVLRTKQTVILDPLPAYERKQIHAYLAKLDYVKTHSEGSEPNRYLVVEYNAHI